MGASLSLSVNRVPGSENVSANTSQVDVLMQVSVSGNTYNQAMDDYGSITIDGTEISIGAISIPQYATVTLYSGRHTVSHNPDGTKTVQVSGAYNINTSSYQWLYASASVMCNTIPRATTPTIGAVTLGSAITISLPRASDAFTHTLTYAFGSASGTIATGAGASASWTPPLSLANQIPSAVSGTGTITCTTYNGSTVIGTKTISFTASAPASVVPTISSCTVSPVNSNTWINGKGIYVVGYTKARVQTSAAGAYGSTIRSVAISLDGRSYTGEDITSELLQTAGSLTASITVTDTRGRTASATRTITVQPYASPAISDLAYQRGTYSGGAWTSNDNGEDIRVTFTLGLSLTSYSNAGAITASCTSEDSQTTSGAAAGEKTYYFTTIGVDNTRTVTISVTDSAGVTASKSMTVATVEVPLNIDAPNNRIAIGGIAEKDKTLQVKWPAEFTGGVGGISLLDYCHPVKSYYMSDDPTSPAELFGGTWVQIKDVFLLAAGDTHAVGETGGEASHTLTINEIPNHSHAIFSRNDTGSYTGWGVTSAAGVAKYEEKGTSAGGGGAHNNMPPYLAVYVWRRTA